MTNLPARHPMTPTDTASIVGQGFSWPLQVDHTGAIRMTTGVGDLDRSIALILMTAPGERLMRPEFGCRIWELLFEPVTGNLLGLIAQHVRDALAQPRDVAGLDEVTGHAVHDHLRQPSDAAGDDRGPAGHRLQRDETEQL